jgi:hypothetical protein
MNGWLIDKAAARRSLIASARRERYHWAQIPEEEVRVSESALGAINAGVRRLVEEYARGLPSKGKTIK